MKPLYNQEEFNNAKSRDLLLCECYSCYKPFFALKKDITQELKLNRGRVKYCYLSCKSKNKHIILKI